MQFLHPLFLIGFTALAIPVIIHLFNFRRYRKVYFTNVRFIAEIEQETKQQSQLRNLLILLMRLLAVASMVLAFAQPYVPSALTQKKRMGKDAVSIYIDNSFSMEALATNGKLLDVAKLKAVEIASAFKPTDQFQLLTNDFEGRHQRFVNRDEFRTLVEDVAFSPSFQPLSAVIKRQCDLISSVPGANLSLFLISDFQKSSTDLLQCKPDTTVSSIFVPVAAEKRNNLYIDSVWFDLPSQQAGQQVRLKVRIRNASGELLEKIPIRLTINKIQKAVSSFSIEPGGEMIVTLPYTNNDGGIQNGILEIIDYPVTWDDHFFFTYTISPSVEVLVINEENVNPFLNTLFQNDSIINIKNVREKQLDYSSFQRFSLIILNGISSLSSGLGSALNQYLKSGGDLQIYPSGKMDIPAYNSFLNGMGLPGIIGKDSTRMKIGEVNTQDMIFADVFEKDAGGKIHLPENIDFPSVKGHYTYSKSTKSKTEILLKLQNGDPFLSKSEVEKGSVFLFAIPLEESWSNFPKHPLFVPTQYRIALLSKPNPSLSYLIGSDDPIELSNDSLQVSEVCKIRKSESEFEFIPEVRSNGTPMLLYPHHQVKEAGHYLIMEGNRILRGIAFNYNRHESDMGCYNSADLEKILKTAKIKYYSVLQKSSKPLAGQIREMQQGTPIWKYFILLVLLFLAIEIGLVRLD